MSPFAYTGTENQFARKEAFFYEGGNRKGTEDAAGHSDVYFQIEMTY